MQSEAPLKDQKLAKKKKQKGGLTWADAAKIVSIYKNHTA